MTMAARLRMLSFARTPQALGQVLVAASNGAQISLSQGRSKARWVVIRGHSSVWFAAVHHVPTSLARMVYDLWKAS